MKKIQFTQFDLNKKAFEIYSYSDFVFYVDSDGCYYCAENSKSSQYDKIGTLKDVERYLILYDYMESQYY